MAAEAIENRGPQLEAINLVFVSLAFLAAVLRCYVRIGLVKAFGFDDWAMAFAMLSFIAYCTCSVSGVYYGTGRHTSDLTEEGISKAKRFWWLCYIFYSTTMIACKISIGWFLLRITQQRIHIWIVYLAVAMSVATGGVFFFATIFQCHPVSYFWDKNQEGTCLPVTVIIALAALYSALSVVADFILAILPIFLVSKLNMERKAKVVLAPLLAMGCVASSAVAVRFAYLHNFKNPDFLFATIDIAVWSSVEQGLAITAGSLATLRPLVKKLGLKLIFSTGSTVAGVTTGGHLGTSTTRNQGNEFGLAMFKNQGKPLPSDGDLESGFKEGSGKNGRSSVRVMVSDRGNESEEELRRQRSSEMSGGAGSVTPQSFLSNR